MYMEKLRKLNAQPFEDGSKVSNTKKAAGKIEKATGLRLPEDLKQLLIDAGGALFFGSTVVYRPIELSPWNRDGSPQDVDIMYGLGEGKYSVLKNLDIYSGRIPTDCVPIACTPADNQILLCIEGTRKRQVYFWDHHDEREITGDEENDYGNMYLIARSFGEFIDMLEVVEDSDIDPDTDNKIESEWFADDF
jgi:hypothetical protein